MLSGTTIIRQQSFLFLIYYGKTNTLETTSELASIILGRLINLCF